MVRRAEAELVLVGQLAGRRRPVPVGDQPGPPGREDFGCRQRPPRCADVHRPRAELADAGEDRHRGQARHGDRHATAKGATTATKTATTKAKVATTKTKVATTKTAKPAAKALTTAQQVSLVTSAIESRKVVAVLFYNTSAADDQAMAKELGTVSTHGGQVVRLAVPVSELTNFSIITQQIPVVTAPTLVLIDADRQATTLTGFADTDEISQRIDDALAAK